MKLVSKVVAGTFVGIGFLGSLGLAEELLNSQTSPEDRQEAVPALFVTAVMTATGSWMFWRGQRQYQQQQEHQLRELFFKTLEENNGRINAIRFAMLSGLDGKAAKAYLDDRAREFNAAYDITEAGTIAYYFELGNSRQLPPD